MEVTNGKEISTTVDLIANNDTELSLFQRLSKRVSIAITFFSIKLQRKLLGSIWE